MARQRNPKLDKKRHKARQKRPEVWRVFGRLCYLCGDEANTIDHVIPLSKGGNNEIYNLRPACMDCNLKKGNRIL